MSERKDGRETRRRLLNAACEVFAEKGYRDATVADICRRAGANVAAVNYYFGDKARLYAETWRHAFEQYEEPVFSEMAAVSPKERLRQFIQILMKNFTARGGLGNFSRLYMMELANPSGLIQDEWREMIGPRRQRLLDILREIVGPKADVQNVLFCEMSIITQCRAILTIRREDLEYLLDHSLTPDLIERLADHIADFSLAGIEAVGRSPSS
jgi:AcrR family transcriptional regulator